jgi:hypothetical protein
VPHVVRQGVLAWIAATVVRLLVAALGLHPPTAQPAEEQPAKYMGMPDALTNLLRRSLGVATANPQSLNREANLQAICACASASHPDDQTGDLNSTTSPGIEANLGRGAFVGLRRNV